MPSVRGVIRQSILTEALPSEAAARRNELNTIANPIKRGVLLGLHELAIRYPDELSPYVGLGKKDPNALPLQAGFDAQVYRVGDMVAKVHKAGFGASDERQQEIVDRKRRLFWAMQGQMPDFTLPQTTDVESHPVYPGVRAVVTRQPYQPNVRDTSLFHPDDSVNTSSFEGLMASPGLHDQLTRMTAASRLLLQDQGMVPDFWGDGNLVVTEPGSRLVMIDGQPLDLSAQCDEKVGILAVARLRNLENALR